MISVVMQPWQRRYWFTTTDYHRWRTQRRRSFSRLDANDIESISVLKDASAAVYGVRACQWCYIGYYQKR